MFRILFSFVVFVLLLSSFFSCTCQQQRDRSAEEEEIIRSVIVDEQLLEDFAKSKMIFYSLPSPLETAMLIKRAGAGFDVDLLNPLSNINRYNTNLKMALNLGIYSANMSYSSLFDQTQSTLNYMNNSRKLADNLGILEAIDEETIRRLEENMNNREVVMDIISETFMNSNAYLTEQDRPAIAAMVLVGGWIEGLYIATQLTNGSLDTNPELIDRIVYQKLSLNTVLNLLDSYKENPDISYLIDRMNELRVIYDDVKIITTSNVEAETHPDKRMTILRSEAETFISKETFRKLFEKVAEIRNEFIS
ncbi:hypothetical protein [Natronoflexus pectinivorans]|uniref:Uncharacterized protein n=1 Tax=Natronoflexus pectinivorans TaxID=682526 RepID=A0A4R2GJW1_9BACT|nr:hypothetical protein [Natronoflexus pectinivorans]TCO09103.1 hypothetical protein EV194_10314 [Natronoflexus pectinivorans]